MRLSDFHRLVDHRPGWVVAVWLTAAALVALFAPSLTQLAAEGQADLLPKNSESLKAAKLVAQAWPDQAYDSMAVAALYRPKGLTAKDLEYARELAQRFQSQGSGRPAEILRVLGPQSEKEVADRLISKDKTLQLVAVEMKASFVGPAAHAAVDWLQDQARRIDARRPAGLEESWTGDAVIGGDYMDDVQRSLDRAAGATVALLLVVLLVVYRSFFLAMVPLITIGVCLVISRGILAWMATAGWELSPLVELFLVVVLFGSGTDFCLFLAWRYGEHWDPNDTTLAMDSTLRGVSGPLLTSAGTVIAGLSLMGTTRFKLFSSTGPSVALGLALTALAALSLTPALLVLVARYRPRSFQGLIRQHSRMWEKLGAMVLGRPLLTWLLTLLLLTPMAVLGLRTSYIQDMLSEIPPDTPSVRALRLVAEKFGSGFLSPLTVVVQAESPQVDLRHSEGLALIDDASRFLTRDRSLTEVRSATQPLGSTVLLDPARLGARLGAVDSGFHKMVEGAMQLHDGLAQGIRKVKLSMLLQSAFRGSGALPGGVLATRPSPKVDPPPDPPATNPLTALVRWTNSALDKTHERLTGESPKGTAEGRTKPGTDPSAVDPRKAMIEELARAADGAQQIADGGRRAHREVAGILNDPVGRHALDRLLITPQTVREHPDLRKSFEAYISRDGRLARIDVVTDQRMESKAAMDQVVTLRRRLREYLGESSWVPVKTVIAGANSESADIRALTRDDQRQTWVIVPIGVFLILMSTLRDPWACFNLVATMLLTYAFALGITHAVFVTWLGAEGLDWKVPYFVFVLLVAVGVDYNVFLMSRLQEETKIRGLRAGIVQAVASTGGLISSAASITACSFASLLLSPLASLRQLGFALVVGITIDAVLVRPVLVPCGHWLMKRRAHKHFPQAPAPVPELAHPVVD